VQRQQLRTGCNDPCAVSAHHLPTFLMCAPGMHHDYLPLSLQAPSQQPARGVLARIRTLLSVFARRMHWSVFDRIRHIGTYSNVFERMESAWRTCLAHEPSARARQTRLAHVPGARAKHAAPRASMNVCMYVCMYVWQVQMRNMNC
jgi:hypothetical protein